MIAHTFLLSFFNNFLFLLYRLLGYFSLHNKSATEEPREEQLEVEKSVEEVLSEIFDFFHGGNLSAEGCLFLGKLIQKNSRFLCKWGFDVFHVNWSHSSLSNLNPIVDGLIIRHHKISIEHAQPWKRPLAVLCLQDCSFGVDECSALARLLTSEDCILTTLDLSYNHFGTEGSLIICRSLKYNGSLRELYLADVGIGRKAAYALADALRTKLSLTHLCLAAGHTGCLSNWLGPVEVCCIVRALLDPQATSQLCYFDLTGVSIGKCGSKSVQSLLRCSFSLHTLKVDVATEANVLSPTQTHTLLLGVKQRLESHPPSHSPPPSLLGHSSHPKTLPSVSASSLETLSLSGHLFGRKAINALSVSLSSSLCLLSSLALAGLRLDPKSWRSFGLGLRQSSSLRSLDLSLADLMNPAAAAGLGMGVAAAPALSHLSLKDAVFSLASFAKILSAIAKNKTICSLDIETFDSLSPQEEDDENSISAGIIDHHAPTPGPTLTEGGLVCQLLRTHPYFRELDVSGRSFAPSEAVALSSILSRYSSLLSLHVSHSQLGYRAIHLLLAALSSPTCGLQLLDFGGPSMVLYLAQLQRIVHKVQSINTQYLTVEEENAPFLPSLQTIAMSLFVQLLKTTSQGTESPLEGVERLPLPPPLKARMRLMVLQTCAVCQTPLLAALPTTPRSPPPSSPPTTRRPASASRPVAVFSPAPFNCHSAEGNAAHRSYRSGVFSVRDEMPGFDVFTFDSQFTLNRVRVCSADCAARALDKANLDLEDLPVFY